MSAIRCDLTPEQHEALAEIVGAWIGEGFTTPPYTNAQYDIFEWLDLTGDKNEFGYDTRRPFNPSEAS